MEQHERIRRMVVAEGLSQREVAQRLGHSRKTVAKALEHPSPPGYRRRKEPDRPVMGSYAQVVDAWLELDTQRPRKQRHTAQRIYERLCDEYRFTGHESTVRRYVAHVKKTRGDVYFPLAFDPAEEAQVDWGDGWVIENGQDKKYHFFCIRLCHSGASFVYPYERMTQESLLDGHVRAFEFFGGVPRRLAYDNLKTVVITVGKGQDRKLTRKFMELKSHYLFETRFCNVASGNEKGHVENLVKYTQRKFLTPLPEITGREDLIAHLQTVCDRNLDRPAARDKRSIRELLSVEQASMLPLPAQPFEACKSSSTFASKQALVRFATNDYSVPVAFAYQSCVVKGFVDRVEVHADDERIAVHERCYGERQYVLDWLHYIPLLERKPGGIHNGRPFKGEPWGEAFEQMRRELEYRYEGEGTKKFIRILLLFSRFPAAQVKQAVKTCVYRCAFSDEAVQSTLGYKPPVRIGDMDLSHRPDLAAVSNPVRPVSTYEALCAVEVAP